MTELTELPLEEQGRMIAALRRVRKGESHWDSQLRTYVSAPRRWSDRRILEALGMTAREFKQATDAYMPRAPRWTQDSLATAVLDFAVKAKRWPTSKELDTGALSRGLPPRSSIGGHFRPGWNGWNQPARSSFEHLIAYIVEKQELRERLTPELVLGIKNVTVRRDAMTRYGVDRLLSEGGGTCVQQDDAGKLWRLPTDNSTDPHAQWVEVINATPEPDGTSARYFLRVPPGVDTAREAVAWSFDKEAEGFDVKVAT